MSTSGDGSVGLSTTTIVVVETAAIDESDASNSGSSTGHVALGVLGAFTFVLIAVVFLVPCIRWRKQQKSAYVRSTSRSPSRHGQNDFRAHYFSSDPDTAGPLLEAQEDTVQKREVMTTRDGALVSHPTTTIPPAAGIRKIISIIPSFDSEGNINSNRARSSSAMTSPLSIRLVNATPTDSIAERPTSRYMADLPPIPLHSHSHGLSAGEDQVGHASPTAPSLRSPMTPVLTQAFRSSIGSPSPSDVLSKLGSISTFRYPSLSSGRAKSPTSSQELLSSASGTPSSNSGASLATPSASANTAVLPAALVPGLAGGSGSGSGTDTGVLSSDTWWRKIPMPPIPEAPSTSGSVAVDALVHEKQGSDLSRGATAKLRDAPAQGVAGPSVVNAVHYQQLSDASIATASNSHSGSGSGLSRSATQRTDHSQTASIVDVSEENDERRVSTQTTGTFGGGKKKKVNRSAPGPLVFGTREDNLNNPSRLQIVSGKSLKRKTVSDYPPEPSPPYKPHPLSFPPPIQSNTPRDLSSRRVSQPLPQPEVEGMHSPENEGEIGPRRESAGFYNNEEGASSSEQLLPDISLPDVRPVSPLGMDFISRMSRTPTASTRRTTSTKSKRSQIIQKHGSNSGSRANSKRSLRSVVSSVARTAASVSRPGSRESNRSRSRSQSHSRTGSLVHERHVTFGQDSTAIPSDLQPSTSTPPVPPLPVPEPDVSQVQSASQTPMSIAKAPLPSIPGSTQDAETSLGPSRTYRPSMDATTSVLTTSTGELLPTYTRPDRPPSYTYTRGPREILIRRSGSEMTSNQPTSPTSISNSESGYSMLTFPGARGPVRRLSRPLPVPPSTASETHVNP